MDYMPSNEFMMSPTSMQPPLKLRKKAPTLCDADWEPHQGMITQLYTSGNTLKKVMAAVKAETGFHAELRQYKSRINKWKLHKNIKPREMKYIVKRRQTRKIIEDDKPELVFEKRGNEINSNKIDRWMREHGVSDNQLYSPGHVASTPSAIECYTNTEPSTPIMRNPTPTPVPRVTSESPFHDLHQLDDHQPVKPPAHPNQIWEIWFRFLLKMFFSTDPQLGRIYELERSKTLTDSCIQQAHTSGSDVISTRTNRSPLFIHLLYFYDSPSMLGQMLDYLVSIGCDIESRDREGRTPLLCACLYTWHLTSHVYLLQLIEHGADVHARNFSGQGALDLVLYALELERRAQPASSDVTRCQLEKLGVLLQAGCVPQLQHIIPEDQATQHIWKEAVENEKKRRSLLPPQEIQHLPPLP